MKNSDKPLYFDTSALLPYYREEALSYFVQTLLRTTPSEVFVSDLSEVEVASAIARWRRMSEISEEDALVIQKTFAEDIAFGFYSYHPLTFDDFQQAKDWLLQRKTALRTCDALHLAYAARLDAVLVTADKKLAQAAKEFGISYQLLVA